MIALGLVPEGVAMALRAVLVASVMGTIEPAEVAAADWMTA